ncbi:hypothetical protein OH77DRAFT_1430992 [Trametes cingulata]|nr:hypothetical protein OH77DRAFT_1430992 [Trametes cingulata]
MALKAPADSLKVLNEDCLLQIFALLRPEGGLQPLSLTCKWIREACLQVLFERVYAEIIDVRLRYPRPGLPPSSLWPHIRCITFVKHLSFAGAVPFWRFVDGPSESGGADEDSLDRLLPPMPRLQRIIVRKDPRNPRISWPWLHEMISAPTLRFLELYGRLLDDDDEDRLAHATCNFRPAPLTTLRLIPDYLRPYPRSFPSEVESLALLLEHLSRTLQTLVVPSEQCASFSLFSRYDWPQLRELCIEGDGATAWASPIPLVSALSRMPRLRILHLKLAQCGGQRPRPIWPPGHDIKALPWPELESLTVSWPCAGDRIFEHLPDTLRHLALRCWPRLYVIRRDLVVDEDAPWLRDAPECVDILGVLGQCPQRTALRSLDLEFSAATDVEDRELLKCIPTVFPHLQELQIYRYCHPKGASPITVAEISATMARLTQLRVLRLHLDFERRLFEGMVGLRRPGRTLADPRAKQVATRTLLTDPGPSLEYLYFLFSDYSWEVHRLTRYEDGGMEIHTEFQRTSECGMPYE